MSDREWGDTYKGPPDEEAQFLIRQGCRVSLRLRQTANINLLRYYLKKEYCQGRVNRWRAFRTILALKEQISEVKW